MTTITQFDKRTVNAISAAMAEALKAVAEAHGVKIEARGGTFSPTGATLKFDVSLKDESGVGGKEADAFRQLAGVFGLKVADLGRTFTAGGLTHTVLGCKTSRTRKPIVTTANGKTYVWPAETVKLYLERNTLGASASRMADALIQS